MVDAQVYMILVAVIGGLISFALGYFGRDPDEPFSYEKMGYTLIITIIGAVIIVIGLEEPETLFEYIIILLAILGIDITRSKLPKVYNNMKARRNTN